MSSLPVPRSIFLDVSAVAATGTWSRILPKVYAFGKLHSLVIEKTSGLAVSADVRIAYVDSTASDLDAVYIASGIDTTAIFSDVLDPAQMFGTGNKNGLWLYIDPNVDSEFSVRIDIELMSH